MKIRKMESNRVLVSALVLVTGLLGGCGSVNIGNNFDLQSFDSQVQHKVSTRKQVMSWLGSPQSKGVVVEADGSRLEKWTYYFGSGQMPGMKEATLKYLEIHFDATGKVVAYNWSR